MASRGAAPSPLAAPQFGEMSVEGSPSRRLPGAARRAGVEPLLNAAVLIMLIVPPVVALGWLVVDSIFDQF